MKKLNGVLWGIVIIAVGVIWGLNSFGVTNINVFFDGWWTLFIIIPCLVGIFSEQDKTGSIIGLFVGVFLLLCSQDVMSFDLLLKIALPAIIVIIGLKMVIKSLFNNKYDKKFKNLKENNANFRSENAVFSGNDINFDGEVFEGAELEAIFGGIKYDLSNAVINHDCAINATAIFGGIDIIVPSNVNIKVKSNSLFGGISNKAHNNTSNLVTLYIEGTCIFGGVDIK